MAFFLIENAYAANISDTLHATKYHIYMDSINFSKKTITARTQIILKSKQDNVSSLTLNLLMLTCDSIKANGQKLAFTHNKDILRINSPRTLAKDDSIIIMVYYHGNTFSEVRFGGASFNGNCFYTTGVGIESIPHNLGRAWFPCIDEFTDKAVYDFDISPPNGYKAFCNGLQIATTTNPNGTFTYHWRIEKPIPTYLASLAVAPFTEIKKRYKNYLPISWAVMPADSNNTKKTFGKIDTALNAFIKAYGPYPFEKVGYVCLPFTGGAMEHAGSIHIGKVFIDGTLTFETLWAHELSHMWWGDQATCATAEDMWLNEGFASYNEAFFTEAAYGIKAYKDYVRTNHREVLQFTHIFDSSYLALNNIPQKYTYNNTVYQKGADVVHTLRYFMGDSAFFKGCKAYLNTYKYKNASSYDLRDALTASYGLSMNRFFEDWVFNPGFPHFSIDSTKVIKENDKYFIHTYTRQRAKGTDRIFEMPVSCTFTDGVNTRTDTFFINHKTDLFVSELNFEPKYIALDRYERVSDAITDAEITIKKTGFINFPETNVSLNVMVKGTDSSIVRIEHNWVAPDGFKNKNTGKRLSDYHYWQADGLWAEGFVSKAIFRYNGSESTNDGYIDNTLIVENEDSLALYYRPNTATEWQLALPYKHNKGNTTDKVGTFTIDTLRKGEYALGMAINPVLSVKNVAKALGELSIFPNPLNINSSKYISIKYNGNNLINSMKIYNIEGKIVYAGKIVDGQAEVSINATNFSAGTYIVSILMDNKVLSNDSFIVSE